MDGVQWIEYYGRLWYRLDSNNLDSKCVLLRTVNNLIYTQKGGNTKRVVLEG